MVNGESVLVSVLASLVVPVTVWCRVDVWLDSLDVLSCAVVLFFVFVFCFFLCCLSVFRCFFCCFLFLSLVSSLVLLLCFPVVWSLVLSLVFSLVLSWVLSLVLLLFFRWFSRWFCRCSFVGSVVLSLVLSLVLLLFFRLSFFCRFVCCWFVSVSVRSEFSMRSCCGFPSVVVFCGRLSFVVCDQNALCIFASDFNGSWWGGVWIVGDIQLWCLIVVVRCYVGLRVGWCYNFARFCSRQFSWLESLIGLVVRICLLFGLSGSGWCGSCGGSRSGFYWCHSWPRYAFYGLVQRFAVGLFQDLYQEDISRFIPEFNLGFQVF